MKNKHWNGLKWALDNSYITQHLYIQQPGKDMHFWDNSFSSTPKDEHCKFLRNTDFANVAHLSPMN